jgi:hypothetical protein
MQLIWALSSESSIKAMDGPLGYESSSIPARIIFGAEKRAEHGSCLATKIISPKFLDSCDQYLVTLDFDP